MSLRRNSIGFGLALVILIAWSTAKLHGQNAGEALSTPTQKSAETRAAIAKKALAMLDQQLAAGVTGGADAMDMRSKWNRRLFDAELAAARDHAGRIGVAEAFLGQCRKLSDTARTLYGTGNITYMTVSEREYETADAEGIVAELKSR